MASFSFFWTDDRIEHLAEHGVEPDEFEEVVNYPDRVDVSRTSGREIAMGETSAGRYLLCVYEYVDDVTIYPVTAFEPDA